MFEPAELHRSYNSQPGWEVLAGPVRPAVERGTRTISARTGPAPSQ